MLDASADKDHLDKLVNELPHFRQEEVHKLHGEGKIKDGDIFEIDMDEQHWKAGAFVKGKLCTAKIPFNTLGRTTPMPVLKRRIVARLLNMVETKWIPTAKTPWLPQKFVNVETGKVLYTAKSIEQVLKDARYDVPKIILEDSDTPIIPPPIHDVRPDAGPVDGDSALAPSGDDAR